MGLVPPRVRAYGFDVVVGAGAQLDSGNVPLVSLAIGSAITPVARMAKSEPSILASVGSEPHTLVVRLAMNFSTSGVFVAYVTMSMAWPSKVHEATAIGSCAFVISYSHRPSKR